LQAIVNHGEVHLKKRVMPRGGGISFVRSDKNCVEYYSTTPNS